MLALLVPRPGSDGPFLFTLLAGVGVAGTVDAVGHLAREALVGREDEAWLA